MCRNYNQLADLAAGRLKVPSVPFAEQVQQEFKELYPKKGMQLVTGPSPMETNMFWESWGLHRFQTLGCELGQWPQKKSSTPPAAAASEPPNTGWISLAQPLQKNGYQRKKEDTPTWWGRLIYCQAWIATRLGLGIG